MQGTDYLIGVCVDHAYALTCPVRHKQPTSVLAQNGRIRVDLDRNPGDELARLCVEYDDIAWPSSGTSVGRVDRVFVRYVSDARPPYLLRVDRFYKATTGWLLAQSPVVIGKFINRRHTSRDILRACGVSS